MPSLPTVGGGNGTWGTQLNDYLTVAHKADGKLKGTIPVINVKTDYGAVGDGTTDDTAACQAAVAAASAADAELFWPAGTYKITGSLIDGQTIEAYRWTGARNARGCNAEGILPGYSASRIVFQPASNNTPLVRVYSLNNTGSSIGPFTHENLAFDIGNAHGFIFGVDDPANPTVVSPASPPDVTGGTGQRYIFNVNFDGCAFMGTAAIRGTTITRSGRRFLQMTKVFEALIHDTSFYGGDIQIRCRGCDAPVLSHIRSQGSHVPIDLQGGGGADAFSARHVIDTLQVEGWTFTPIRVTVGIETSVSHLRTEQIDVAGTGIGRYSLGTCSVTADSATITFPTSMTNILIPDHSLLEVTSADGTKKELCMVSTVSGTTVTIRSTITLLTWTDAAATAVRIHGYGPIHDSQSDMNITGAFVGAALDCPAFVFVAGLGNMHIVGASAHPGAFGNILARTVGNRTVGQSALEGRMVYSGALLCGPNEFEPFTTVLSRPRTGGEPLTATLIANRINTSSYDEQSLGSRRRWAFAPGKYHTAESSSTRNNPIHIISDGRRSQGKVAAWLNRTGTLLLADESFPDQANVSIRVRFRARSVASTGTLGYYFYGNGGGPTTNVTLDNVLRPYEFVIANPAQWATATRTVTTALIFSGTDYYLAGVEIEELAQVWRTVGATGEPAFLNSWVTYDPLYASAAFHKDTNGFVHLRGFIKTGTPPSDIFTLPVGYRPEKYEIFVTLSNGAIARLDVKADGAVRADTGSSVWFSLSGVSFAAA